MLQNFSNNVFLPYFHESDLSLSHEENLRSIVLTLFPVSSPEFLLLMMLRGTRRSSNFHSSPRVASINPPLPRRNAERQKLFRATRRRNCANSDDLCGQGKRPVGERQIQIHRSSVIRGQHASMRACLLVAFMNFPFRPFFFFCLPPTLVVFFLNLSSSNNRVPADFLRSACNFATERKISATQPPSSRPNRPRKTAQSGNRFLLDWRNESVLRLVTADYLECSCS